VSGEEEYTDDQLRDARAQVEKETGQPVSDREMIARFGRSVPRTEGAGPTDGSSRTIRADELDPVDTSKSGRHAAPGLFGKVFRRRS